ncbi:hypothetical protein M9H77_29625 [Catharanthus roseus]|uniref:Uncharacterized protein n=1 Tax=Catharanthus roseus TaxID=4058 RepID=A0ACB9ZUZ0_CATRO|nr:hypothetical protein M9H77_29625 [Catharanthus roseus]
MTATRPRCGIIGIPLHIKPNLNGIRGTGLRTGKTGSQEAHEWFHLIHKDDCEMGIKVLIEQVLSRAPHVSEGGEERGEKFHEVWRIAKEDAEASGTAMPNNLQLIAIVAGGAAHFIAESSRAAARFAPVSIAFDKHMRQLFEHNQLAYIPFPPMIPLIRAAMSADTSTYISIAVAAGTSEFRPCFQII